ncbi:phosphohistidine phosphatase [Sphingomonas gellani]|uniref:Phosphohistidine phosphatase n=2 Tax=Sphingomonas gellani TaxID=1166340 RepID=A0A1H8H6B3_9SPHN|nr:phosphohistidine phosphatase [Sphingomonas gellani]
MTLLRHAKAGSDDQVCRDFDRALNAKGRRAAEVMGRHLREVGLHFDHVIASPAVRVAQTLEAFATGYGAVPAAVEDRRIYLASAETLLEVAQEQQGDCLLMVGHNPGLEDLVLDLVRDGGGLRDEVAAKYPTASVAQMTFEGEWADLAAGCATLVRFVRPRDLDPELGPDFG